MTARITRLQRFPVKGLSAEPLDSVDLSAGSGVPGDRMFGFARHGSGFDPEAPRPLPKDKFVVLLTQAGLAGVHSRFDPGEGVLHLSGAMAPGAFDMGDPTQKVAAAKWLAEAIGLEDPSLPEFVSAAPHRFTDVSVVSPEMMNAVSVLNLASVRDLEAKLDAEIDPARFRANIELDGLPPWWELDTIGATLRVGEVELRLVKRTQRCAATEVNPATSARDLRLPYLLRKTLGHMDMGAYADVIAGGQIAVGDTVRIS